MFMMFVLIAAVFGFLTVPGMIQSCGGGNTLLYIAAWGYGICMTLAVILGKERKEDDK